ncbi:hypothetical protein EDD16DRAFT_1824049 [Pisolithus croceorrhizus]|nr:hypothetical protein EDD16DRAFT_1824049 [Pisolithus croceorrhizus]
MDSADDVSQKRGELDRCPPGYDGRDVALCRLAATLHCRFESDREIDDLNMAITLYRAALELRPVKHADRASSLHDIAQCLAYRFRQTSTVSDLDDAVTAEREALQLLEPGNPDFNASRRCLIDYVRMTTGNIAAEMASSDASDVTEVDIKQLIRIVALETLGAMPTRLLDTRTGNLCNRDAQISDFMGSKRCIRLESLCKSYDRDQQMKFIRTEVLEHFQYTTLSHRWGEGEPSLRDIEGRSVYNMPLTRALRKLQYFCTVALERDCLWAWSDTCCIDKHSGNEVQETILSMFAWYRQSALTVVYLCDVVDTDSFVNSEWFNRGWTLQELLAPRTILFYTRDWSLYKNLASSNHKMDAVVLEELETATGIESRFPTNSSPGMDNARLRLQWASMRRTTRPEDIVYSLFGIFDVRLPILYGESAENALGRLLVEIVSVSDVSVLDWIGEPSQFRSYFPSHITWYRRLPSPLPRLNAEERPLATSVLRNLSDSLSLLLHLQFLCHSLAALLLGITYCVPAILPRTPVSSAPSDVFEFYSLISVPLPRFFSRHFILPCVAYHVTMVELQGADPSAPSYTYNVRASGLVPLRITLPAKLADVTKSRGVLYLVRPWPSRLHGPSAKPDVVTEEQLSRLEEPFNALLLSGSTHNDNEHKRIASSTLITAQPTDRASILKSKVRIFRVV